MKKTLQSRIDILKTVASYTFGVLSTDVQFKDRRLDKPLAWKTVVTRVSELTVSLNASKGSYKLIKNLTYPALLTAQLQTLHETMVALLSDVELASVEAAFKAIPSNTLDPIVADPSSKNAKSRIRHILADIFAVHDFDRMLAYAVFISIALSQWLEASESPAEASTIFREIRFSPEHQQAGIAILSYFAVILKQKLPDVDATVSITQEADRVVLTISHPDGTEEKVSQALSTYGLVVRGELSPEELLENPIHVIALKHN